MFCEHPNQPPLVLVPSAYAFPGTLNGDHYDVDDQEEQISDRIVEDLDRHLAVSASLRKSIWENHQKPGPKTAEDLALNDSLRKDLNKVQEDMQVLKNHLDILKMANITATTSSATPSWLSDLWSWITNANEKDYHHDTTRKNDDAHVKPEIGKDGNTRW
ncbi:hypothetical protein HDU76_001899 [Blyttiomyces sp. JEL0837]|nr:hypothetical protein HDU76_001899 [Blyttiomyces sp. JEL0837]